MTNDKSHVQFRTLYCFLGWILKHCIRYLKALGYTFGTRCFTAYERQPILSAATNDVIRDRKATTAACLVDASFVPQTMPPCQNVQHHACTYVQQYMNMTDSISEGAIDVISEIDLAPTQTEQLRMSIRDH